MSGFFGFGVIPGGTVRGSVLGSSGYFGPVFVPDTAPPVPVGPFAVVVANDGGGQAIGGGPQVSVRDSNSGLWTPGNVTAFGTHGLNGIATDGGNPGVWIALSSRSPAVGNGLTGRSVNARNYALEPSGNSNTALGCSSLLVGTGWCSAGDGNNTHTSPDGINWTTQLAVLPFAGSFFANDIIGAAAQFIVVGQSSGNINHATSNDGIAWFAFAYTCNGAFSIIFDGVRFLSTVRTLTNAPAVVDPIAGAGSEVLLPTAATPLDIAFRSLPALYCVIAGGTVISAASVAGLAAGTVTGVSAGTLQSICCGSDGIFIAVDNQGAAFSSGDGLTWTTENPGLGAVFLACIESG